jgi:lipid A disaccharide synthetase
VIGRTLKRAVALRALSRQRFIALPNQRAGRLVAPEWIGTWPEEAFVSHLRQLLQDRERRAEMGATLRGLYAGARGASRMIAERSLALAGGVVE